jgi:transcriptional regulator with XRE-family HTH domain
MTDGATTLDDLDTVQLVYALGRTGQARGIREAVGMTLRDVAVRIDGGVAEAVVSRWERGLCVPNTRRSLQWARVLREVNPVGWDRAVADLDTPRPPTNAERYAKYIAALVEAAPPLTDHQRHTIATALGRVPARRDPDRAA